MLTQALAKRLFSYNSETGLVMRREYRGGRALPGTIVGTPRNIKGHLSVGIGGKYYPLASIIWLYVNGRWPIGQIDHINGVTDDNRLVNLREADCSQNKCNQKVRRDSESRIKGVTQDKRTGRWRAYIGLNGRRQWLGFFTTIEEATEARRVAALRLHGAFAKEAVSP